jgi:putative membrane-bound dehydrogenase-like protein
MRSFASRLARICAIASILALPVGAGVAETIDSSLADFVKNFKGKGAIGDPSSKPLSPRESLKKFTVADGLEMQLVASEPVITQPLNLHFDERGRLWVVQYIQYPFPAGLKIVKYDEFLRAVFDKVPEPPPRGVKGADKITILEDKDGDGVFESHKDFLTGLNIATSVVTGHGGVWVMNPPYLVFYPDKNRDDAPDGDPEVRLSGFGLEDTHAVANGLAWGPDGWLYGATGSTTTATVNGIHFLGQAIWRYQPDTREFEIFAEGGGNTWGVEFDEKGRIFSGTNYSDVRGLHFVQGGYYVKNFAKHGPLTNPYAFGFFEHMTHRGAEKLTHVCQPFVVYAGGAFPQRFNGQVFTALALSNRLQASRLEPIGSTFNTQDIEPLATSTDRWFRPVALTTGPDGAVYIADWYDIRLSHVDPRDTWDRSNGRVFRLQAAGAQPVKPFDLAKMSDDELIGLLSHPNKWFRQTARRVMADRATIARSTGFQPVRTAGVSPAGSPADLALKLKKLVETERGQLALEALWALHVTAGLDEQFALRQLDHPDEFVRAWVIRLVGDTKKISSPMRDKLVVLARTEPSDRVRSQLASSCKRWPAREGLSIVRELLARDEDGEDKHIPLLLWWAIESKAVSDRDVLMEMLGDSTLWRAPIFKKHIVSRLAQRYTADRSGSNADDNLRTAAKLIDLAPDPESVDALIRGIDEGLIGNAVKSAPDALIGALGKLWNQHPHAPALLAVMLRVSIDNGFDEAVQIVKDPKTPSNIRSKFISLLGENNYVVRDQFLDLLKTEKNDSIKIELLNALQHDGHIRVATETIALIPKMNPRVRATAFKVLSSREHWSHALLEAVDRGGIKREEIPAATVALIQSRASKEDATLIKKIWGTVRQSSAEKEARIAAVRALLAKGKGDAARGHEIFKTACAVCHTLNDEGGKVGPDLTGYERDNLDFLLPSIVDPSLAIREEYTAFNLETKDGQSLTGFVVENTPQSVTISDVSQNRTSIPREQIKSLQASPVSLMPEGLLDAMSEQQVRDLLAYLMKR